MVTPAGEILRDEIARSGPVSFRRFMEVALYHPEHGYYRRRKDPFGKHGDYFTAEQIQPVFGILLSDYVRQIWREGGEEGHPDVVELGAGRAEMAPFFSWCRYRPLEIGGDPPPSIRGVVFANEFFDALPVHVVVRRSNRWIEMGVGFEAGRFCWVDRAAAGDELAAWAERYAGGANEGQVIEVNLEALGWIERLASHLDHGFLLAIDYGYTAAELVRFPAGTLMSYRRHRAMEDVLSEPGHRDITAHVNFSALEEHALRCGFERLRFESMGRMLLRAGEADRFGRALAAAEESEGMRRRLQLKTLLFGMGETFRTLLLRRQRTAPEPRPEKKSGPGNRGRE